MFKLLLNDTVEKFLTEEHQSMSNEGNAEGKWIFVCLRGDNAIFRDRIPRPRKSSKDLEFCLDQRERTLI